MGQTIASQLAELGFAYEGGNDEWVIYSQHGSAYNERVYVLVNTGTGEVELNREHDEITERPTLTVKCSAWDDSIKFLLERWTS